MPETSNAHKSSTTYEAYPGFLKWLIIFPCVLPLFIGWDVYVNALQGRKNEVLIFLIIVMDIIALALVGILGGIVIRTKLEILKNEILHEAFHWQLSPPRLRFLQIHAKGDEIYDVKWARRPNSAILIRTRNGDISFRVLWHPQTNQQIMQEILAKIPHLKSVTDRK